MWRSAGVDQLTGTLDPEMEALAVAGKSEGADFAKLNAQITELKTRWTRSSTGRSSTASTC